MITDNTLVFSNNQAITTTADSTNVLDLLGGVSINTGVATVFGEELGYGVGGMNPQILCIVNTAFVSAGGATLTIAFQGSSDSSTWNTYVQSPALAVADLVLGSQVAKWVWPSRASAVAADFPLPRYFKLVYTVGTSTFSAGKMYSTVILDRDAHIYYPPGFSVGA